MFIERAKKFFIEQVFGDREDLPRHRLRGYITEGGGEFTLEIEQPKNPVTVKFPEGTRIWFEGEKGYRELEPDEVVFAEETYFFGEGMTTGRMTDGRWFKALNEPAEITPLKDASED